MEIDELRREVDRADNEIISLLSRRMDIVKAIAIIKKSNKAPIFDKKREIELLNRVKEEAKGKKLSEDFISKLYELILEHSRREQEK
jgi:monofunctional chorismate mutase|tara:strand:+ start:827 stop:1087 length:261 start_codon:yes stop_codon:yes gene_type:complete